MATTPADVLEFWFGRPPRAARAEWFRKDPDFDAAIRGRFGAAVESALGGAFEEWTTTPHGTLARVILLDQFTRNIYRDTPGAFAGDAQALADASAAVDAGFDRELDRFERWFLYLPFEHAEDWSAQQRSLELFGRLADETGDRSPLGWAEQHAEVIRRFGRYPHRNVILGRPSTPEELAFLAQPGSSF
jgi:uncharacterized protein (DUF924 family)